MAESEKGADTPPTTQNDVIVVPSKGTTEVLNSDGSPLGSNKNLEAIFGKIESGQGAAEAIKETMGKKASAPTAKAPEDKVNVENKQELEESDLNKKLTQIQDKKEEPAIKDEKADDDPRKALLDKTTIKDEPVVKVDDKQDEVPDDELQVLPHDKPKTAKRIQALLTKVNAANETVATTKKEVEAKAQRLKELEAQLAGIKTVDPKVDEAIKQQLDELAMYRRQHALDKDPEVKAKFGSRIEAAEKPIAEILKRNGLGDDWLKIIEAEGGWNKFASSPKQVAMQDGKRTTYAEAADLMINGLPTMDRKAVEASVMEHIQATRDRERYFEEEKGKAKEYFSKQDEAYQNQVTAQKQQIEANTKAIDDWQKAMFEKEDWLKEKEVPADATPEQKKSIEDDNQYTKQLGQLLKQTVKINDLPKVLEMAKDSVKYYDERRKTSKLMSELASVKKERDAAKAEVDKIRSAGKSTPKSGSIATQKDTPTQAATKARPPTLEDAFDKIARGENVGGVVTTDEE